MCALVHLLLFIGHAAHHARGLPILQHLIHQPAIRHVRCRLLGCAGLTLRVLHLRPHHHLLGQLLLEFGSRTVDVLRNRASL